MSRLRDRSPCPTTMVIEFARIKRRSCASVATFEKYRAICERQRRRVFTASTAQDDAQDPPTD